MESAAPAPVPPAGTPPAGAPVDAAASPPPNAFMLVVAFWALVSGVLLLGGAFRARGQGRGWMAVGGVASLVWDVMLILAPAVGAVVLTLWLGAYALVFGIAAVLFAWRLRRGRRGGSEGGVPPLAARAG